MVCFAYRILLKTAKARPEGYLAEVLKLGHRRGPDVCMSSDTYRMLRDKYAPALTPAPAPRRQPTWTDLIANFTQAAKEWAAAGYPLADRDTLEHRRFQCEGDATVKACPHWDPTAYLGTGGCRLCGCSRAKLWLATSHCPASPSRWHAIPIRPSS